MKLWIGCAILLALGTQAASAATLSPGTTESILTSTLDKQTTLELLSSRPFDPEGARPVEVEIVGNFLLPKGSAATTVPEPSVVPAAIALLLGYGLLRRRQSRHS